MLSSNYSKLHPEPNSSHDDVDINISDMIKDIPGSYGLPLISPIKDRLDFYYFQGEHDFFQSRADKYQSTIFRTNMPPGPFMASNPKVICLLDAKSFPVLFDTTKVKKRDVFTGTYMPSTSLTGGYRVCSYLDPSEPNHTKIKQLLLDLLALRKSQIIPAFRLTYSALFDALQSQIKSSGSADYNKLNDDYALEFLGRAYFGASPKKNEALGSKGPEKAAKWLLWQLCPLLSLGLPKILEEIFLHTFPLPPFLVKRDYNALYDYFSSAAADVLANVELVHGLSKSEACHNLLFATVFNSYGGFKVFLPGLLSQLAEAGPTLHKKLAKEIRGAVKSESGKGEVTFAALSKMELTASVVYEALRIDPPVKFQYGKAKTDLVIESHEAAFRVKKGEMLFGYQPFATRDGVVFHDSEEFVADRFVGEKGKGMLKYVFWSNGPETESPTVGNKQCPGKDLVVMVGKLLLVELFLRYDTFTADVGKNLLGTQVTFTSVTEAATTTMTVDD